MILKKPYAFFIKMFKPLHLIMAILVGYLISLENAVMQFFTNYIQTTESVVGKNLTIDLYNNFIYIIPIVIIIFSLLMLGIMFRKEKPIKFYLLTTFSFIVIVIINVYVMNFLQVLEETIVSIKTVKLMHDIILLNIIIETLILIFLIIRGMGINFKKFDFDSEIAKFDISESDKEEFELEINVDLNEAKRKRKKRIRNLKYLYQENQFIINLVLGFSLCVISIMGYFVYKTFTNKNVEGQMYLARKFSFGVDSTIILNTDYSGKKITNNNLIIVDARLKSTFMNTSLYLNDFSLNIEGTIFKPTKNYSNYLSDLGNLYEETILDTVDTNYLFVYEVPDKYMLSEMYFTYNDIGKSIPILLEPKNLELKEITQLKNISDEMSFSDTLGDIKFKINEYEIRDRFLIEYNYCINENDCLLSREYIKASIDKNYDKHVLKLNVEYFDNSNLKISNFYNFLSKFGNIQYKINNKWYIQMNGFEQIKSTRINKKNIEYIGINSNIMNATSIKLVFTIRGHKYEYILKGEV